MAAGHRDNGDNRGREGPEASMLRILAGAQHSQSPIAAEDRAVIVEVYVIICPEVDI